MGRIYNEDLFSKNLTDQVSTELYNELYFNKCMVRNSIADKVWCHSHNFPIKDAEIMLLASEVLSNDTK